MPTTCKEGGNQKRCKELVHGSDVVGSVAPGSQRSRGSYLTYAASTTHHLNTISTAYKLINKAKAITPKQTATSSSPRDAHNRAYIAKTKAGPFISSYKPQWRRQ